MSKKVGMKAQQMKSLQFIIAIACWAVVVEKEQTNEKGIYHLMESLYLGDQDDDDIVPMHSALYDGDGRFQYLYDDQKNEKIAACFGSLIGGLSKRLEQGTFFLLTMFYQLLT